MKQASVPLKNTLETPEIWFRSICRRNGILISEPQLELLSRYVEKLLSWNRKINLISRQDEDRVWENHILHSSAMLFKIRLLKGARVLDLGSGGGLPGIPLKILCPDLTITLLDATRKKVGAVEQMISDLGIAGLTACWGRAEEISDRQDFKGKFDYVVARAVAPLKELVRWSFPFLKSAGLRPDLQMADSGRNPLVDPPALVALKGGDLDKELAQSRSLRHVSTITETNLVFDGSEQIAVSDKKIVIANFDKGR